MAETSKLNAYAVTGPVNPESSKFNAYVVTDNLSTQQSNASKFNAYAVLNEPFAPPVASGGAGNFFMFC